MEILLIVLLILVGLLGGAVLLGLLETGRALRALGAGVLILAVVELLARI